VSATPPVLCACSHVPHVSFLRSIELAWSSSHWTLLGAWLAWLSRHACFAVTSVVLLAQLPITQ
jgi:hypothetical protein